MDAASGAVEVAAESSARALKLRPLVGGADPVHERRRWWLCHCGCRQECAAQGRTGRGRPDARCLFDPPHSAGGLDWRAERLH